MFGWLNFKQRNKLGLDSISLKTAYLTYLIDARIRISFNAFSFSLSERSPIFTFNEFWNEVLFLPFLVRTLCHQINESPYRPRCKHRNLYSWLIHDYALLIKLFIMENMESSFTQRTAHWEYKGGISILIEKKTLPIFCKSLKSFMVVGAVCKFLGTLNTA